MPIALRLPPFVAEGVVGLLADTAFTVSQTYRRKQAEGIALHGRCFHSVCWGAMVDRQVFSPETISADARAALRSKLTFGRPDDFLLVYAGRISAEKGLDFCVELLRQTKIKHLCFAIIGAGPQEAALAVLHGQRLGKADNMVHCVPEFVGQPQVAAAYCAADAYFTGSEFETLGFGAIEAMSCGAPALCPAAQGFQDTVDHRVTGYLYRPRSVDDCEACLMKLMEGHEIDPVAVLKAGEHMTIAGCAARAIIVYGDALVINKERSLLVRVAVIALLIPLAIVAGVVQLCLYYTGLSYAVEEGSRWYAYSPVLLT